MKDVGTRDLEAQPKSKATKDASNYYFNAFCNI